MFDTWITQHAEDLQVILFFSLFLVFAVVEIFAPGRPRPVSRRRRWWTNLALTAFNIFILSILPVSYFAVAVWSRSRGIGLFNAVQLAIVSSVTATLLIRAFVSFFTHWLMHNVPLLWRVHRVHHLDTEMDVTTTVRFHPLEFVVNLAVGIPLLVAFGPLPWVLLFYEVLDAGVTVFSHANIRLPQRLEKALHYFVVTPDLHRVHHSSFQPETDSNFGAVFPIWDLLLGTFRTVTRDSHESMELGLEEVRDLRVDTIGWLMASPFLELSIADGDPHGGRKAVTPPHQRKEQ